MRRPRPSPRHAVSAYRFLKTAPTSLGFARRRVGIGRTGVDGLGIPHEVGLILFVLAIIPVGDMLLILAAKGSTRSAFGMHGLTAVLMVLAAIPMMIGAS